MRLKSGSAMDLLRDCRRMPLVPGFHIGLPVAFAAAKCIPFDRTLPSRPSRGPGARLQISGRRQRTEEQSLLCSCSQTETQASEEQEWRTVDAPRVRDMTNLLKLPTWADDEYVFAVVETPRSSTCKLDFDPKLGVFTLAKPLMAGLSYPYDWGFIPSTKAQDGDPLDVLIVHDAWTYPGVVLKCRPVGVLEVEQKSDGKKERNDRVFAVPDRSPLVNRS